MNSNLFKSALTLHAARRTPHAARRTPHAARRIGGGLLFSIFLIFFCHFLGAQSGTTSTFNPCSTVAEPNICTLGWSTCTNSSSNYECSPGYCFTSGGTVVNGGIPPSGLVENKTIVVDGVYKITVSNYQFVNCNFKMLANSSILLEPGSGKNFATFENCRFFGCDAMWRGITVDASACLLFRFTMTGDLTSTSSLIEDAYAGITMDEYRSNYIVTGTTFQNNYIGVTNKQRNGLPLNAVFTGNQFIKLDDLSTKPPSMNDLPMLYHPWAFAGMEYFNTAVAVGIENGSGSQSNLFSCLRNGIRATNSAIASHNNNFQDIPPFLDDEAVIWCIGGSLVANRNNFYETGWNVVYSEGTNLDLNYNFFTKVRFRGIYSIKNLNGEKINIANNTFVSYYPYTQSGIHVERSQATGNNAHVRIVENTFLVPGDVNGMTAIRVTDPNNATDELLIKKNNITYSGTQNNFRGIWVALKNSNNANIFDNTIHFAHVVVNPNNLWFFFGIFIDGFNNTSLGHEVRDNTVTGTSNNQYSVCGIHTVNSQSVNLCENTVDYTNRGFHFPVNSDVALRENNIGHHHYGILIGAGGGAAQMGVQVGRGNLWSTDPGAYTEYAAAVDPDIVMGASNPLLSKITIFESNQLPYFPPASLVFPDPSMTEWIEYNPLVMQDYCVPFIDPDDIKGLTKFESDLALGNSNLSGGSLWDAKRQLYRELLKFPQLRPVGSPESSFFQQQTGTIVSFGQVAQQIDAALNIDPALQTSIDNATDAITGSADQLRILDNNNGSLAANALTEAYFESRNLLLSLMASQQTDLNATKSLRNQQIQLALTSARAFNNGVATTAVWETARRTINDRQIGAMQGEPFTATSYAPILALAQMGSGMLGIAADEAVSLLFPCDQADFIDDGIGGESQEREHQPIIEEGVDVLQVTPNPNTGIFTVTIPTSHSGTLNIQNLSGQLIRRIQVPEGTASLPIDLGTGVTSGWYFLSLLDAVTGKSTVSKVLVR